MSDLTEPVDFDDLERVDAVPEGDLPLTVRRALVTLLTRRFVTRARNREVWKAVLDYHDEIEERLADLGLTLVVWLQSPVTVFADDGTELAVLLEPGSTFTFPEHPFGPNPWRSFDHWSRTHVLQLYRADLRYSVWMFFEGGELQNWYLNFEAPLIRQVDAIDTLDYGLDLVLGLDGSDGR